MRAAAHSAAAAAISNSTGSSPAGRPIDMTRSPAASSRSTMPTGAHSTTSWRDRDTALLELCAHRRFFVTADRGERNDDAAAGRDRERGDAVVRDAAMAIAWIGERCAQARDRRAREAGRGVEHRSDLDAGEPEPGRGSDDSGTHHDNDRVRVHDPLRDGERAVHRDRLVVSAERVTARDRRVDEVAVTQLRDQIRQRERQARRRRSSRRRGGPSGRRCLNATAMAGSWLCSAAATTGIPSIDTMSASSGQCSSVLPTSACRLV